MTDIDNVAVAERPLQPLAHKLMFLEELCVPRGFLELRNVEDALEFLVARNFIWY